MSSSPVTTKSMTSPTFKLQQLATHDTQQDLWIAIHGKVYDLTSFASDHPGGIDVLKDSAGTDGTEPYDYAGHDEGAILSLQRFQVGVLEGHSDCTNSADKATMIPGMVLEGKDGVLSRHSAIMQIPAFLGWKSSCVLISVFLIVAVSRGLLNGTSFKSQAIVDGIGKYEVGKEFALPGVWALLSGFMLASACMLVAMTALYARFIRTLRHEKEVFEYPSVIKVSSLQ